MSADVFEECRRAVICEPTRCLGWADLDVLHKACDFLDQDTGVECRKPNEKAKEVFSVKDPRAFFP